MVKPAVVAIHIAKSAKEPTYPVEAIRAVPGKGLEDDRYFTQTGTFCTKRELFNEVTLIETEAVEALKRDYGIEVSTADTRRNIATRGVALNHLVGREFKVGSVMFRGIRLCEPCSHLESLTRQGIKVALKHRGGLRAQVLTEGVIHVGDSVDEA